MILRNILFRSISTTTRMLRDVPKYDMRTDAITNAATSIAPLDVLLDTAWVRHHLYMIGSDLVRLTLYQKLSHLIEFGGGPVIKNLVYEMSSFLKQELGSDRSLTTTAAQQLRDLVYFGSNVGVVAPAVYRRYNIPDFRWIYITIGYMVISQPNDLAEDVINRVIDIYINTRNSPYLSKTRAEPSTIVSVAKDYYKHVPINYNKLYSNTKSRYITLQETKDYKIMLPPLPRLKNKETLVKALIHKELYRAWLEPNHKFAQRLLELNVDLDDSSTKDTLKYELSFLDGLGDLFLARESSNLLYKFKGVPPLDDNGTFSTRTYNQLRIILATNTLLSKLAIAYKLHEGLSDKRVHDLLIKSYVPNIGKWEDPDFNDDDCRRYEQEFLADYFEQYIGALFLEQPEVAQHFILEIYENILRLISDVHKLTGKERKKFHHPYDYRAWSVDVIGRNIWR